MIGDESAVPRGPSRGVNRRVWSPARRAWVSSSQSPVAAWRRHGLGWSASRSSYSIRRARPTRSVLVRTSMPFSAGRTQEAVSTRPPATSTVHTRHTPTGVWCWAWQRGGMSTPRLRAASKTRVPAGTSTAAPSMVSFTRGVGKPSASLGHRAHARRTAPAGNVVLDLFGEVGDDRLDRRRRHLPEAADGGEHHRLGQLVDQVEILALAAAVGDVFQDPDHLGRAQAAGDALAAGLVPEEADGVERHVEHAGALGADDDRARAQHRSRLLERFEVERHVHHRGGEIARRRPRRRERLEGAAVENPARLLEDHFPGGRAPRDLVDPRAHDLAADADALEPRGAGPALTLEPLDAVPEDQRHEGEGLHVVDERRLLPEPVRAREGRLVAGLGALALQRLQQRGLLPADVTAGAQEDRQVEGDAGAEDVVADQALAPAGVDLGLQYGRLDLVLVPDVEDPRARARHHAGQDHALDHQVGDVLQEEAVLDRARLALVRVADDVLLGAGGAAHDLPLHARRKPRAAQPPKLAGLEGRQQAGDVAAGQERPEGLVAGAGFVRVDLEPARKRRKLAGRRRPPGGPPAARAPRPAPGEPGADRVA